MNFFKKMSTIALGATMVLGLGLSLGLNNNVAVKAADDGKTWGIIGGFTSNNWGSDVATSTYDSTTDKHVVSYIIPQWTNFKIRQNGGWDHQIDGTVLASVNSTYFAAADGSNPNAYVKVGGRFTFSISPTDSPAAADISVTYAEVTSYTVTKYAVIDGVKEETALGTETAYSDLDFYPSYVLKSGYYTEGWYTDEACTTPYVKGKITADTSLYAKYAVPTDVKYCYFTVTGWSGVKAYSFGGQEQLGIWDDGAVLPMTDGATLNGVGGVYKTTYYTEYGDTHIIFHGTKSADSSTIQTADLVLSSGVCYQSGDAAESSGSVDLGSAASVVFDLNSVRVAVTAAEPILEKSYCGVSAADATALVAKYDALNETAKGYVDASTDYTYNHEDPTGDKVDVSFTAIIAQLKLIAGTSSTVTAPNTTSNTNVTLIVCSVLVCVLGLTAAGVILVLKRKKETF